MDQPTAIRAKAQAAHQEKWWRRTTLTLLDEVDRLRADVAHLEKTNAQMGAQFHRLRSIEDAVLAIETLPPGREKVLAYIALTETLRAKPHPSDQADGNLARNTAEALATQCAKDVCDLASNPEQVASLIETAIGEFCLAASSERSSPEFMERIRDAHRPGDRSTQVPPGREAQPKETTQDA